MIQRNAGLNAFRTLQTVWVLLLLGPVSLIIYVNSAPMTPGDALLIVIFVVYGLATIGLYLNIRLAWGLSLFLLAAYWLLRGWMSVVNFLGNWYLFVTWQEPYPSTPLAIIAVCISAVCGFLPAAGLLVLALASHRDIVEVFKDHAKEVQTDTSGSE